MRLTTVARVVTVWQPPAPGRARPVRAMVAAARRLLRVICVTIKQSYNRDLRNHQACSEQSYNRGCTIAWWLRRSLLHGTASHGATKRRGRTPGLRVAEWQALPVTRARARARTGTPSPDRRNDAARAARPRPPGTGEPTGNLKSRGIV